MDLLLVVSEVMREIYLYIYDSLIKHVLHHQSNPQKYVHVLNFFQTTLFFHNFTLYAYEYYDAAVPNLSGLADRWGDGDGIVLHEWQAHMQARTAPFAQTVGAHHLRKWSYVCTLAHSLHILGIGDPCIFKYIIQMLHFKLSKSQVLDVHVSISFQESPPQALFL